MREVRSWKNKDLRVMRRKVNNMVREYEPIYTVKEVSRVLKVNTNTVYEYMNSGMLPYLILGSKKVRGKDLEEFINKFPVGEQETCE